MSEALQWAFIFVLCLCACILDDRYHKLKASYTALLSAYLELKFEAAAKKKEIA